MASIARSGHKRNNVFSYSMAELAGSADELAMMPLAAK
jgi:hypothetical protein